MDVLDTNIFVLSTYSELHRNAVHKFINENENPIPYSLFNEIYSQTLMLLLSFQKISREIEKGVPINKISEIDDLLRKHDNIYGFLKLNSNNFTDLNNLKIILEKGISILLTIEFWVQDVKHYPEDRQIEKNILKKYESSLNKLNKIPDIHYDDLKILAILNHACKKTKSFVRFVTRDKKSMLVRKKEIEAEFPFVKLIKIKEYLDG